MPRTNPLWTVSWTMLAISLFFWPLPLMDNVTNAGYTRLVLVSLDLPSTGYYCQTWLWIYCPVIWMKIPSWLMIGITLCFYQLSPAFWKRLVDLVQVDFGLTMWASCPTGLLGSQSRPLTSWLALYHSTEKHLCCAYMPRSGQQGRHRRFVYIPHTFFMEFCNLFTRSECRGCDLFALMLIAPRATKLDLGVCMSSWAVKHHYPGSAPGHEFHWKHDTDEKSCLDDAQPCNFENTYHWLFIPSPGSNQ